MSNTVNPMLARFAADLNDAYDRVCEATPGEFFELFSPVVMYVTTGDGLTLRFWEEGVEFYPEEEKA